MDSEFESAVTSVVPLHPNTPDDRIAVLHRDVSIQPHVSVAVIDMDEQTAQFACELTILNKSDDEFQIGQVRARLPVGITLNEAVDFAHAETTRTHEKICESTSRLLTNAILLDNENLLRDQVNKSKDAIRKTFNARGILEIYMSFFMISLPNALKNVRDSQFKIFVRSSEDIARALEHFPLSPNSKADVSLARYNLEILKSIEESGNYNKNEDNEVSLRKGQEYKIVYILCARRGWINPSSFSIGFEVPFRRENYSMSRMEYARISVPPGSTWPTIIAMLSSAIGSYIQRFGSNKTAPPNFEGISLVAIANGALATLVVPMLTALIVYNIYDMTALKDKFQSRRGWRSGIMVGFFCGFLNQKILGALSALFQ
ncbi:hypothetical protein [Sphingobium yanoikuyae]|uniref:hypothetical protein n=1 Tax=Sphingobium yanoikuyae TaxID=13690 RepID=UPI0028ADBE31|nr:hypothetical protein [Sphingobium yanoikuyae]